MRSEPINASRVLDLLPLTVEHCALAGPLLSMAGLTQSGAAWTLSVTNAWSYSGQRFVAAWGDSNEWLEKVPDLIVGETIVGFEGPEDLFDASIRLSSGALIRQLSSEDDVETWFFHLKNEFGFVGPGTAEHRRTLGVGVGDERDTSDS
ncbi:MAG: hypothetical protein LBE25_06660 [Arthrobacter sp.]|jgi:hypothetical protein|nr:hypothetical protein [Arthrobacter sp.]